MVGASSPSEANRRGVQLEGLTIGWNAIEAVVAILAALAAGSIALMGFGLDSVVEAASGTVLLWRLLAERRTEDVDQIEALEHRAQRLVALSLFALALYVAVDAARALVAGDRPDPSRVGMVLAVVSLGVMWWLAREKREVADRLGSRAMEADAFQTTACFWLSVILLAGIGLNAGLGWWWADPVAALGMTWFIAREGWEVWSQG